MVSLERRIPVQVPYTESTFCIIPPLQIKNKCVKLTSRHWGAVLTIACRSELERWTNNLLHFFSVLIFPKWFGN